MVIIGLERPDSTETRTLLVIIASSQWPGRDDAGELTWRVTINTTASRPEPPAGRLQTLEAALHNVAV
ncbi:hypothetical protein CH262_25815 [Rhodococcus sp. 05-2255-1e]|nr:hypothetical protein CH262_25815 [Rhodococcus sp. 05-2255-1e]